MTNRAIVIEIIRNLESSACVVCRRNANKLRVWLKTQILQ